jgi:N-acetyl-anhydromuramyl-L-alanine amidase AmpD
MKIIEQTYLWARTNFARNKPDIIVVHHAQSPACTAENIHKWHLDRGWKGIAYHYFIRKDGSIFRGRQETWEGGHLEGRENKNTIGICLEGNYDMEKTVPEAQLNALIRLCGDIETRWNIKAYKKHADYQSAKKEKKLCPGVNFPWNKFIGEIDMIHYKRIIQSHVKLDAPQILWDIIDKHPYKYDLYRKLAEAMKGKV